MSATDADLALALELADLADGITIDRFGAADLAVDTKPDMTPVTEADTAVEHAIRERLAAARPGDSIVGEEYGVSTAPDSSRRWVIDPIDGTMNYVRGVPVWATLLALQVQDEVTVGVVSAPALRRRWWASRGAGAYMTDGLAPDPGELRVSQVRELSDAQLSFGGLDEWDEVDRTDALLELGSRCWRSRGFGDFWSYMLVAEGGVEIALDPVASVWDLAATLVIVEEAGGRFTDLGGVRTADGGDAVATNGMVHEAALAIIGRS
jgi:histidinol-phosphatase